MSWRIVNEIPERAVVACFALRGIRVSATDPGLDTALEARGRELRAAFEEPAAAVSIFAPARRLYLDLGIDPTRHRPSSEALVRRILQGKGLYRVNTAVDAANLASITHHRPVGLYDADRIRPEPADSGAFSATLRLGREGEAYPGINKDMIHLAGRPTLADLDGPFGNPSSDSDRTKITLETKRLLFVLFEPRGETPDAVREHLALSLSLMRAYVGGEDEG